MIKESYDEIIKNIPGNGKFLYSPFSVFDNESIIECLASLHNARYHMNLQINNLYLLFYLINLKIIGDIGTIISNNNYFKERL